MGEEPGAGRRAQGVFGPPDLSLAEPADPLLDDPDVLGVCWGSCCCAARSFLVGCVAVAVDFVFAAVALFVAARFRAAAAFRFAVLIV